VLEGNASTVAEARRAGEPITFGDATRRSMLDHLAVGEARLVVIAISDPLATRAAVSLVRSLAPRVPIVARTRYVAQVTDLHDAGATLVVAEEFEATLDLLARCLRTLGVPGESIERLAEEMRSEGYELLRAPAALLLDPWLGDLLRHSAPEWVEVPNGPAAGRSLAELEIRSRTGASVLALERDGVVETNPGAQARLAANDRLLVLAGPDALLRLRALFAGAA
jgi:CPA2 family monovalent cation:H+ antiporter-2